MQPQLWYIIIFERSCFRNCHLLDCLERPWTGLSVFHADYWQYWNSDTYQPRKQPFFQGSLITFYCTQYKSKETFELISTLCSASCFETSCFLRKAGSAILFYGPWKVLQFIMCPTSETVKILLRCQETNCFIGIWNTQLHTNFIFAHNLCSCA